jgi:nitroreductase
MAEGRPGDAVLRAIRERRSVGRVASAPLAREEVAELIEAATCAPNHHLTGPWRFIVLAGPARGEVGAAHARAIARRTPGAAPEALAREAARLERAPVVVACVVRPGSDPVEAREDRDAVAAGVQNLLLAAHARGLGAMWRTGSMVDEPEVAEALGLEGREAVVGFVYIGRHEAPQAPRATPRPPADAVTVWRGW